MPRRKQSAAAYIADNARYVSLIIEELAEHAGQANAAWLLAVEAVQRGDLDRAETSIIDAEIDLDILVGINRLAARKAMRRALRLLDREVPNDEADE